MLRKVMDTCTKCTVDFVSSTFYWGRMKNSEQGWEETRGSRPVRLRQAGDFSRGIQLVGRSTASPHPNLRTVQLRAAA